MSDEQNKDKDFIEEMKKEKKAPTYFYTQTNTTLKYITLKFGNTRFA